MAYINGKQVLFSSKIFGRGGAIVEVAALPTTEIDKGALYRTPFGVYWYDTEWHKIVDEAELEAKGYALESTVNDVSEALSDFTDRVNAILASDDTTLDELQEIVTFIKNNSTLIEQVTTNKVNVTDIVDNLSSSATNKPLSAKQGKALKALIDAIVIPTVPTKISAFENDKGYLTAVPSQYVTAIKANTDAIAEINEALENGVGGGVSSWNDLKDRPFYESTSRTWVGGDVVKDKTSTRFQGSFGLVGGVIKPEDFGKYEVVIDFTNTESSTVVTRESHLLSEFTVTDNLGGNGYLLTLDHSICVVRVLILTDYDSFVGASGGNFGANGTYLSRCSQEMQDGSTYYTNYSDGYALYHIVSEVKTLDEKFIPDTIARVGSGGGSGVQIIRWEAND